MTSVLQVLIYNGQLDLIVPYTLTMKFIGGLEWKNASEFQKAPRIIWKDSTVSFQMHC